MQHEQPGVKLQTGQQDNTGANIEIPSKEQQVEATDASIDPRNEITGLKLLILHIGLCLCNILTGLDFTLIAAAVPTITAEFDSIGDVGWYGGAFYLALCASQPLAGKAYILFPKKIVYLSSVGVFELGSLVCALTPTSKALIVGRAVAGLGASGIFAGGLIIITTIIPLSKRAIWQGTLISTFGIASIVGPVLGGALTQITWRWCFYINLPIGCFSAFVTFLFLHVHKAPTEEVAMSKKLRSLDGPGFVFFAGSIIMLLLALQWGGTIYAWNSSIVIGLFCGSGVLMPIFIAWSLYRKDDAMIPPRIFAERNFSLLFAASMLSSGPFQVVVYWLPIWFQAVLGVTPTQSGVRYLATVISDVLTSFIGSGIVQVIGWWNPFLLGGFALLSVGCGLLTTLYPTISDGHWIGYQILNGVGYSLSLTMIQLGTQASLPQDLVPIGSTCILFGQTVSCAVWLAVAQAVFQERLIVILSQSLTSELVNRVLSIGATQLRSIATGASLSTIIDGYSASIINVFYIPAAAPVLAFLFVAGARWTSVKKPKEKATEEIRESKA